jgi:hypothetical protein
MRIQAHAHADMRRFAVYGDTALFNPFFNFAAGSQSGSCKNLM